MSTPPSRSSGDDPSDTRRGAGSADSDLPLAPTGAVDTASVVVVTYERVDYLVRCLDHLRAQTRPALEVLVVDSSPGGATARMVRSDYPEVHYLACPAGYGAMATARNQGYLAASGDVIAFVDDDAFAEPDWLERLLPHYDDPGVGAVGGRQIRHQTGELTQGVDAIGHLDEDGFISGNFGADPGRVIEVDHLLGANMSFRRSVLDEIGGIRDGYAGTCVREETDLCLRVAHTGYRLLFVPDAVVEHVAAPYAKGRRFDIRYHYWDQKNHLIVLMRNFGPGGTLVRRYLQASLRAAAVDAGDRLGRAWSRGRGGDPHGAASSFGGAVLRPAVVVAASVTGLLTGLRLASTDRRP
jgi:GT2 family glycosyltransferase